MTTKPKLQHFSRIRQEAPRACRQCIHALRCLAPRGFAGTCTRCGLTEDAFKSAMECIVRKAPWWEYTPEAVAATSALRTAREEFYKRHPDRAHQ